jgi:sugar transferase (PEP-CTERM/EpsH1 system associated)
MVDVDSQKWLQYASNSNVLGQAIYAREGRQLLSFERRMAQVFDSSLFVSDAEAALFRRLAPESASRVFAIGNGVDVEFFSPDRDYENPYRSVTRKLVFTGAMDYRPNIEAVIWFVEKVMPELFRSADIEFWIVGSNPSSAVRSLTRHPGVHVTGRVVDVRPYLCHADVVVAPLLTARGIQNKVLEAMAMAKPVIVTPQAREGIDALDGKELLVASDPGAIVAAMRIALSPDGRLLGERAREKVVFNYSWSRSLQVLDRHLRGNEDGAKLSAPAKGC